jgi:hypothetical protein
VAANVALQTTGAGPRARLFHVENPGKPRVFSLFAVIAAWLRERFYIKSVSCRLSRLSGFLIEGKFYEQERTGVRRR